MSAIDVEKLLQPVTDDSPCGDDMEYAPAYLELQSAATVEAGASMLEGDDEPEPPKWREVAKQAETLLGQSKDLRIAMFLSHARLDTHGVDGLGDGIALIKGLLTTYWDNVHPKLDEEDDNDPTMRINALHALTNSDGMIGQLREVPLVKAKRAGNYSFRDIRVANGELPAPGGKAVPETGIINAAFQECELDVLKSSSAAVIQAIDDLNAIEGFLTEQVGAKNNTLTVKPLADELRGISKIYADQLGARGVNVESASGESVGASGNAASGEIQSRDDAIRMLEKVSEYFRRNEPSSPVPMLLQRAKGLISKDFMEILRDLTPDAVSQAEVFGRSRADD